MDALRIHLFGQLQVYRGQTYLDKPPTHKAQCLFCYLVLHRHRPHARSVLANLFWGDSPEQQARKCLRTALWRLRSFLEPDENSKNGYLLIENDEVCFNAHCDYWLDVEEFENHCSGFHLAEVQGTASTNLDAHTLNAVQQAVELYQGDLLEGYYEDWCLFERERLQGILLNALAKLMAHYRSQGAYEQALRCGQRILHDDPLLEEVHREMMRLHCLAGNRGAALRQYGQCRAILAKELDIGPMEETTVLYEQICGSGEPGNPGQTEAEQDPFSATQAAPQPTPNAKQPHRPLAARMDEALHEMRLAQQEVQRLDTRFRRTVTVLKNIRRQVGDTEKA